jgi:hypothetical protein
MALADRLGEVLAAVMSVETEDDGALTVRHDGTVASLRVVTIAEGLEMVSLTQMLAWDLPNNAELCKSVAALAHTTMLGTVTMAEQAGGQAGGQVEAKADVMLRYNVPAGGLDDRALQTLMVMVLAGGSAARRALV